MIESAHKINDAKPVFQASFQHEILEHWQQIQRDRRYPAKRDFRPQNFPRHLPQLALVDVDGDEHFTDRLTGTTIAEVLRLSAGREQLVAPSDENISDVVQSMLDQTTTHEQPMYFEGKFTPETSQAIDFSALILPFSCDTESQKMATLLLAFSFSASVVLGALS